MTVASSQAQLFPDDNPPSPSVDDDPLPQRIDASARAQVSTLSFFLYPSLSR